MEKWLDNTKKDMCCNYLLHIRINGCISAIAATDAPPSFVSSKALQVAHSHNEVPKWNQSVNLKIAWLQLDTQSFQNCKLYMSQPNASKLFP